MFSVKTSPAKLHVMNIAVWSVLSALALDVAAATTPSTTTTTTTTATTAKPVRQFGTYATPFAADSLWNSRPIKPVFGTFVIPKSSYYPVVGSGSTSSALFLASATDKSATVSGVAGTTGVADLDIQGSRTITIPHWPASVVPTTNSDAEADIFDPTTNIIHSFWGLKQVNGQWVARLYAWSHAKGTGFGDPAHFYQGSRAAGVVPTAGMIRAAEVKDGQPYYNHALAMSMTYNGLSAKPAYIYPATSADNNAALSNTGGIPEGALMMLPPTYDTTKIANADLRKVAETLKLYGAYVVDRNDGTPYAIHVEGGVKYDLHNGKWDNAVAAELDRIRAGLRQVVSAASWVDGNGQPMTPKPAVSNLLSMRGPWARYSGTTTAVFDSWSQTLQFPASATPTVMYNGNGSGVNKVSWGMIAPGSTQKFTVSATGGAKLRLQVYSGSKVFSDSRDLGDKESVRLTWPPAGGWFTLTATSGVKQPSTVSATLTPVTP